MATMAPQLSWINLPALARSEADAFEEQHSEIVDKTRIELKNRFTFFTNHNNGNLLPLKVFPENAIDLTFRLSGNRLTIAINEKTTNCPLQSDC